MAQRGWEYKKSRANNSFNKDDAELLKGTNYYDYNNVYKERNTSQQSFIKI